jgi:two-component system, OmpR family, sensor kinase
MNAVYEQLFGHVKGFQKHYQNYINLALKRTNQSESLKEDNIKVDIALQKVQKIQSDFERDGLAKLSISNLRNNFVKIRALLEAQTAKEIMPKQILREMNRAIDQVLRFSRLLNLHYIENECYNILLDTEEFKEALRSDAYTYKNEPFDLIEVISDVKRNLEEFAERSKVEIKFELPANIKKIILKGDEHSMYFAFYNVLHNAIKYSWSKRGENLAWVSIKVSYDSPQTIFSFENHGVPIDPKELKTLGDFGNRGWKAKKERGGNGIGLWHSKKIINAANGIIRITSDPVNSDFPEDLEQPFLTNVTITFPNTNA